MRAGYLAVILGVLGGLVAASLVMGPAPLAPRTIAEAMGLPALQPLTDRRRAEAVAVLTARCMQGRGHRWEPVVETTPAVPDADLDPVAWAGRWGFGVATGARSPDAPMTASDPNLERLATLPAAERTAVLAALDGAGPPPGCRVSAVREVYGLRDRLLAPLAGALAALEASIDRDPLVVGAQTAWRACVRTVAAVIGDAPFDRATIGPSLIERFAARLDRTATEAGRVALAIDERRVATTVAECEMAYVAARTAAGGRHVAAWVEDHRAELERIGAAIRSAEQALPRAPP